LDKEIDIDTRKSIDEHLALCPKCKSEIEICASIKKTIQKKLFSVIAPINLRDRIIKELNRAEEYRESGVDVIDLIRWGSHIAQLYNSKDDVLEIVIPYLAKGLEQNELCIWVVSDLSSDEARYMIENNIKDAQKYIDKGQLQILSYEDWFPTDTCSKGHFTINCILNKCVKAIASGYEGIRVTGVAYSKKGDEDWNALMKYEHLFDNEVKDSKLLAICSYKEDECSGDNIIDVMNTHKYVLTKIDGDWKLKKSSCS
jgi:hypothetical protein